MNAVDLSAVNYRRGRFALRDIDLVVPQGSIVGFAGPNGAGKTTTIKTILGLLKPSSGTVTVLDGRSPCDPETRERIGVVFDQPMVTPEWQIGAIGRRLNRLYQRWDAERYSQLLERFALSEKARAGELSRGEGVKLSLAMAMSHDPQLLVLDEPSTGLDPVSRAELGDLLRDWMTDGSRSVLFSTHIISELDNLADFIQIIHDGRIVLSGELESLRERFAVVRASGVMPAALADQVIGLRQDPNRWDALIRVGDTPLFGADVVIDAATTEEIVLYFARHRPTKEHSA